MLCIDLIGKYQITPNKADRIYAMKGKKDKDVFQQEITMIDPAIDWIEISSVPEARTDIEIKTNLVNWIPSTL